MIDLSPFIPALDAETLAAREAGVPESDAPRLQIADWCEENGQGERAEFIRLNCQMTDGNWPTQPRPEHVTELNWRKTWGFRLNRKWDRMLKLCSKDWLPAVAQSGSDWDRFSCFRRGFMEVLTMTSEDWLTHHAELCRCHPIREVRLTTALEWRGRLVYGGSTWPDDRWPLVRIELMRTTPRGQRAALTYIDEFAKVQP